MKTILKRKWWVPLLSITICLTVAFFYLRYTKPVYQSSMLIQLADNDKAKQLLDIENANVSSSVFNSNIELLRSQLLFEVALRKMNVSVSLYQEGKLLTEEKYLSSSFNVQPYSLKDSSLVNVPIYVSFEENRLRLNYSHKGKDYSVSGKANQHLQNEHFDIVINIISKEELEMVTSQDKLFFEFNSIQSLSDRFLSNLSIEPVDPDAQTIEVKFDAYNAKFCTDLINSLVESFFQYDLELKRKGEENIINFIDAQLDSLRGELKSSKDSLVDYQRRSNFQDPESSGNISSNNLIKLQDQLFVLEDELNGLNEVASKLRQEPNRLEIYRLLPEMLGKSYESSLSRQIEELHTLLERKENLLFSVTEENSEIKALNSRVASRTAGIRKSVSVIQQRLLSNSKTIRSKIGAIEGDMLQIPEKKMEYGRLKSVQDLNDKYFSLLTEKKVMYAISSAGYSSSNRILSRASINLNPIKPNTKQIYSGFLGIGTIFGLLILFVSYARFNEINYVDDLKKILPPSVSHLGGIPLLKERMDFSEILVFDNPKSMISEALRNVRTNMNFVHPDYQTVAISSSVSGEGKTFVSLNLAAIIAMTGKKTILIDLDMRKPKVHIAMGMNNKIGMSNTLINQNKWQECIKQSKVDNLDFISAGPAPPNPSELILGKKMVEIIEELKKEYDIIVFDNPPVGVVSDGVKLLSEVDIPIYVFKSHFSKRSFAERVEELVEVQKITNLCVILNGEVANKKSYGYSYEYYEEDNTNKTFFTRIFGK